MIVFLLLLVVGAAYVLYTSIRRVPNGVIVFLFVVLLVVGAAYVLYTSMRRVPSGMIGLQTRRFGRRTAGDSSRVSATGGPGPQAEVLRSNAYYFRPPILFDIEYVPQTYVPPGTIGLVQAKVGRVPPPGTRLAPFIACNHFQDGAAFLRNGGFQGQQMEVLTSGHYDINPDIFDVITIDNLGDHPTLGLDPDDLREIEVEVGETGVVITHLGATGGLDETGVAPPVHGHNRFQYPWVFLHNGGQLGVQSETLPAGGFYTINPWFAHVVKIPTRNLVLEWSKATKAESNFDVSLEQIVLDVQGYTVRLDMKQTLRIPEEAAPRLVHRFGDRTPVQRFVEKELATIVTTYFRRISVRSQILEFITRYDEMGVELFREVKDALARIGIEGVATSLEEFECEPQDMNELRRSIALERNKIEALNAQLATTSVAAEIEQIELELEAARRKLDLVQIQGLVELLGPVQVATERILAEWARMGVPQTIASGTGDQVAGAILQAMPFTQARDMLLALAEESGRHLGEGQSEQQQAIKPTDDG